MADLSEVETAMVQIIADSLGVSLPYLPTSVVMAPAIGLEVRIARGWPVAPQLDADLKAGISTVTVFPITGMVRHSLKYLFKWHPGDLAAPTLTATVSGSKVIFGGLGGAGQVAGVAVGNGTTRPAYAVRLAATDTPTTVAAALAAKIPGATASGAVVTIPTNERVIARVAADQPAWLETRRQDQGIWVMTWCPTPMIRDSVASVVDAGFANMQDQFGNQSEFFGLPDGSNAWIKYAGIAVDDQAQQAGLYRRNLRYTVQYPTTLIQQQPEVVFAGGSVDQIGADVDVQFGDQVPTDAPRADFTKTRVTQYLTVI